MGWGGGCPVNAAHHGSSLTLHLWFRSDVGALLDAEVYSSWYMVPVHSGLAHVPPAFFLRLSFVYTNQCWPSSQTEIPGSPEDKQKGRNPRKS